MRYNHAKDLVRGTVEQTGSITLDRNYHHNERHSSRIDVEMSSMHEADEDKS